MRLQIFRRRAFTLIEVMVALSLVAILVGIGLSAYSHMSVLEREGDQLRHFALQQRLAQTRLASLFLRVPTPNKFPEKSNKELPSCVFYSSSRAEEGGVLSGSLVFTYDNQTDLWPEFCNNVIARLYVKQTAQGGALWLTTWPRPACSMDPLFARHEQILEGVRGMSLRFFEPPAVGNDQSNEQPNSENGGNGNGPKPSPSNAKSATAQESLPVPQANHWNETWSIAYSQLPILVHLHLDMEDRGGLDVEPLDFYFSLLNTPQDPWIVDKE